MRTRTLLLLSLLWTAGALFAQTGSEEKIAAYIRSHTEDNCRNLFSTNGFRVTAVLKGYPQCFDTYEVYVSSSTIDGKTEAYPTPARLIRFEKDKIISKNIRSLNCEIVFTLTAKNNLSNDCVIFVGTNGIAYVLNFFRFSTPLLIKTDICSISFLDNTVKSMFRYTCVDDETLGNSENYDFRSLANDIKCKAVNPVKYDYTGSVSDGMRQVSLGNKYGFIDETGTEVIPLKYENPYSEFSDGIAPVKLNGKWGFIDKTGKELIAFKYDYAYNFSERLVAVRLNGKWGFIDKAGNEVIAIKYDEVSSFENGLAAVNLGDKYGYIDKNDKAVIPLKYDRAYSFSGGMGMVKSGDGWGFIDKEGAVVVPLKFTDAFSFSEGLAAVKMDGKWGYIDKTGKEVVGFKYDWTDGFSEGLARVRLNGKYGFIDKTGGEVIAIKYYYAGKFSSGRAPVEIAGRKLTIDKTGKEVLK